MINIDLLPEWDGFVNSAESLFVFPDGTVCGDDTTHSQQFRALGGDPDKMIRQAIAEGGIRVHAFPGSIAMVLLGRPTEAQWRSINNIVEEAGRYSPDKVQVYWTLLRSLRTGLIGGWSDKIGGTGLKKLREATTVRNNPIDHAAVPLRFCERCKNPVKSCAECGAIPERGRCQWCGSTKTSIGRPSRWVPIPGTENEERICDLCWKAQRIHGRPGPSPARGIVRVNPWDDSPRGWIDPAGKFYVVEPRSTHAAVIAYEHADAPQLDEEDEKGRPKVESMLAAEAFGLSLGWIMISGFGDEGVYNFVAEPTAAQRAAIAKAMRGRSVIWVRSALQKSRLAPHTQVAHGTGLHWSAAGKRTRKNPADPWDQIPTMSVSDVLATEKGWKQEGWITQDGLFHVGGSHESIVKEVYRGRGPLGSDAEVGIAYRLAFHEGAIRAIAETAYGQFSVEFRRQKFPSPRQIAFLRGIERGMRSPILWECWNAGENRGDSGSGVASLEKFLAGVKSNPSGGGAKWVIARPTHPSRARADGGGKTVTVFVPMPQWGEFPSRAAAVRSFMEAEDPDLTGKTDEFIGTHFAKRVRLGHVRVVRVGSNPPAIDWSPLAPAIGPGDVDPSGFGLWVTPYGRIYDASILGGESHPTSAMAVSKLDDPYRAIMAVLAAGAMRVSSHEDAMAVSFTKWPTPYQVAILRRLVRECGIMTFHWDRHDERTTKVAESGASMKGLER